MSGPCSHFRRGYEKDGLSPARNFVFTSRKNGFGGRRGQADKIGIDVAEAIAKVHLKERSLLAALVVPAAIVVIVLAFLQYKWSNQVSEATSVRLADSLQMSMINWHLELFRDLSQICLTLGVDPEGEPLSDLHQFAGSFAEWRATAQYPDIVSNLYVLTPDGPGHSGTLRFNPATGGFEGDSWPTNLVALRGKLSQIVTVSPGAGDIVGKFNKPSLQTQHQQFMEGIYPRGPLIG